MRVEANQGDNSKQVQIRIHPDEASHLLRELQDYAGAVGDEGESLAEALQEAGVEPYEYPAHYRMEYRELDPSLPHEHRRDSEEEVDQ
jgi:hypothetical protein